MTAQGKIKAGPITLACGLILGGAVLLLHNLGAVPSLAWLWKLSPLLLVGIGLEYFLRRILNRDPEIEVRFSGGSLLLIILLIIAAGAISSAGGFLESMPWWSWTGQSYTRTWESQPLEVKEGDNLVVDNPVGRIDLMPASGTALTVRAVIHSPESGPDREQADHANVDVARSGNQIFVRAPTGLHSAYYDLEIKMPLKTDASVNTSTGMVTANDLQGRLDIQSNTGKVELRRISGSINLQNDTGSIYIIDPGSDVTAKTGSGSLTLSASQPLSGKYDLEAGTGKIGFAIPASSDLAIRASSETGSISVSGLNGGETGRKGIGSTFDVKLGNGKGLADLLVGTGAIEIRANGTKLDSGAEQTAIRVET